MKDYMKVIITVVITFLATSFLSTLVNKSSATQKDLILVKTEAFGYTDKQILQHEKVQQVEYNAIKNEMISIKETGKNTQVMVERLLDLQLNNKK